jgi:hypothetical protein
MDLRYKQILALALKREFEKEKQAEETGDISMIDNEVPEADL